MASSRRLGRALERGKSSARRNRGVEESEPGGKTSRAMAM